MSEALEWAKRSAYAMQKRTAKQRGVPFLLSFSEWWMIWEDHWPERRRLHLCMARTGDAGPYALGNVRITTTRQNVQERCDMHRLSTGILLHQPD